MCHQQYEQPQVLAKHGARQANKFFSSCDTSNARLSLPDAGLAAHGQDRQPRPQPFRHRLRRRHRRVVSLPAEHGRHVLPLVRLEQLHHGPLEVALAEYGDLGPRVLRQQALDDRPRRRHDLRRPHCAHSRSTI